MTKLTNEHISFIIFIFQLQNKSLIETIQIGIWAHLIVSDNYRNKLRTCCYWGDWKKDAKVLSFWQHCQPHEPNKLNWNQRTDQRIGVCLYVRYDYL